MEQSAAEIATESIEKLSQASEASFEVFPGKWKENISMMGMYEIENFESIFNQPLLPSSVPFSPFFTKLFK